MVAALLRALVSAVAPIRAINVTLLHGVKARERGKGLTKNWVGAGVECRGRYFDTGRRSETYMI